MKNSYNDAKAYIEKSLAAVHKNLEVLHLMLTVNVEGHTKKYRDFAENSITTEFLSLQEFEELLASAQDFGIYTSVFFDSLAFVKETLDNPSDGLYVLFETTQKGVGKGKDSFFPAYCDLLSYIYSGPNAFVNSLTSNKYCWTKFLSAHDIRVPRSWRFDSSGWLDGKSPPYNLLLISKPLYECASIGVDDSSVGFFSDDYLEMLCHKTSIYSQPFIVQELISGYEVEVPVICTDTGPLILPPIGLSIGAERIMNNHILSFNEVACDGYGFYSFSECEPKVCRQLEADAFRIAQLIEATGYIRIDFRVTLTGQSYVIDINAYPHIVSHSSFAQSFQHLGFRPSYVLPALIGNAIMSLTIGPVL